MRWKRAGGFSLIEILIALAILSMGLLGVARLQVAAIRSLSYSRHLSTATQLGQEQLEMLRTLPFDANNPNVAPRDQNNAEIRSYLSGTPSSPYAGDNTVTDGITSAWHSHWNNPVDSQGDRASSGEWPYIVRWTVERGGNANQQAPVVGVPGIGQIEFRLQVIWWENTERRPANYANHSTISGWTDAWLDSNGASIVELRTLRQQDL